MKIFKSLVGRNVKLFFKDKGLFFTSLITPLILLVLYATFLANVYRDSLSSIFSQMGVTLSDGVINGAVGGQLLSSLLSVSCITVSFCSNMLMVQDKVSGARKDMLMSPVKPSTMALSYYVATTISTLIICLVALTAGLIYIATIGWYLSFLDVLLLLLDVIILVTLGTALSSVINYFLSTQGQISAVGSIVSSCYGFISGAYMPLSSFSQGLRDVLMFSPGTYGTSLLRNHCLNGVIREMTNNNLPEQAINGFKDAVDCNIYFFGEQVSSGVSFAVLILSVALFIGLYVFLNARRKKIK
ncbi:MAG: ABC transporter permease [Clostridiales bacterium]|nr:ABC transporter permease [Clostridiales bacterium]